MSHERRCCTVYLDYVAVLNGLFSLIDIKLLVEAVLMRQSYGGRGRLYVFAGEVFKLTLWS